MSSTAGELRSALQAGQDINRTQQALTEESRVLLVGLIRDEMQAAVADGIRDAMTPEAARLFWSVGLDMVQEQARMKAGRFVLDSMWTMLRKGFWVAVVVTAIYSIGGWALVSGLWKAAFPAR
jgi:hypothetical protein